MPNIHRDYSLTRQKGNIGEDLTCLFLMKRGFRIVERNYLKPWGELDIVAEKENKLHFIEVKSVSCEIEAENVSRETVTHVTVRPEEHMTDEKGKRLKRVLATYMQEKKVSHETPYQIDLVTVKFDETTQKAFIELFEGVL